jgi:hypothetical protein
MTTGMVFDIREFTVHDRPGIRTTVFLKGCPLACTWCHNREGLDPAPQVMRSSTGERTVGRRYGAAELAELLSRQSSILTSNEGGVTFSGGEPITQASFVAEVIDLLRGLHIVIDTFGFGGTEAFVALARRSPRLWPSTQIRRPWRRLVSWFSDLATVAGLSRSPRVAASRLGSPTPSTAAGTSSPIRRQSGIHA